MTLWNDMIFSLCLLLLFWLLRKEYLRENRLRLPARMAVSVLAVISLACLELPLSYNRKIDSASSGREGVLLTEGYEPDSLRVLLQAGRAAGQEMRVYSALEGESRPGGSGASVIDAEMPGAGKTDEAGGRATITGRTAIASLSQLHVLGYGLNRKQWSSLHPPPLVFHASPSHAGIVSVSWKQKLSPGEKLRVQGRMQLTGRPVKLLLTGMGTALDSVVITGASGMSAAGTKEADFEFSTIPAQSGRSVYELYMLPGPTSGKKNAAHRDAGMDTLERESLPIEVLPGKKLKILLLAASPDFENTFLVNWLSRHGDTIATRTAISKGKSDKAFVNMPKMSLDPLTPSLLDKFDMVIADAAALQGGSEAERAMLRRQVAEKGMGLIIKADSVAAANWEGISVTSPGTQPLLRDSLPRVVVSCGIYGAGKLVFTTLHTTYARMLSGAKKEYAAYWSLVLQKVARESEPVDDWQFSPELPRVNEPVEVLLQTGKSGLPQGEFAAAQASDPGGADAAGLGHSDGAIPSHPGRAGFGHADNAGNVPHAVYLAQAPLLPFYWQGRYWPTTPGWQSSTTLHGDSSWWYAWSGKDWPEISRRQRREETEEYILAQRHVAAGEAAAMSHAGTPGRTVTDRDSTTGHVAADRDSAMAHARDGQQDDDRERVPLPKAWLYILFLISCLFLWVERKI